MLEFYKYHGAGNDFLIADNRGGEISLTASEISYLCDRRYGVGADGLMLLESSESCDFKMVYYNSDGSGGMMCGNGGRCIVAFASDMGVIGGDREGVNSDMDGIAKKKISFEASDGLHEAYILKKGKQKIVRLKMIDVQPPVQMSVGQYSGYFLNTGTRHFVLPVEDIQSTNVVEIGKLIRYDNAFAPIGTNVNFVQGEKDIYVRTYEKGVEDETFACGTGIVASAIASYFMGKEAYMFNDKLYDDSALNNEQSSNYLLEGQQDCSLSYKIRAVKDNLEVDFVPVNNDEKSSPKHIEPGVYAKDVWLTGPATYVAKIMVEI